MLGTRLGATGYQRSFRARATDGHHLWQELTTKCGRTGVNAFYCTADQQVYYSNLLPQALPGEVRNNKWTADIVMAHEFGHAVQGRTGILVSGHALGQESGDEGTALRYMRRLETQADCFSGMFVRSVSLSLECNNKTSMGSWPSTPPSATTISPVNATSSETTGSADHADTGETLACSPARLAGATRSSLKPGWCASGGARSDRGRAAAGFRSIVRWRLPRCLHRGQSAQGRLWWSPKDSQERQQPHS